MDNDPELKAWTSDWQSGGEREYSAEAIRLYAQGRSRFMWTWILSELPSAGVALPLLAYLGWMATDQVERWAMALLAVITIAAVSVGWWNWRGSLLASARTDRRIRVGVGGAATANATGVAHRLDRADRGGRGVLGVDLEPCSTPAPRDHTPFAERFSWGWLAFMSLMAVAFLLRLDRWIRKDEEKFE